jgi:ATP-dependent Zn protease
MEQCHRPWWKRPPFWFLVIATVIALLIVYVPERGGKPTPTPYSTFLDQLKAGNIASVTFQGTEIHGRYKHPLDSADSAPASSTVPPDTFSSRVPDFGDPTLIPELRRQHVAIDVSSPSQWAALLARIPWPMLLFLGAVMIAALVRLLRGRKAQSGPAAPTLPAHGMIGLVSGLFAKRHEAESPPKHDGDEPKSG